ncbi:hypothetical protein [Planococcus glaciei]|uniref:hypothetical protein n=1 Tax=Planococcus glaciei TaxID=459472 RepID=UPI0009431D3E|nr:hypothetical protein [Planococcus glaciei]
MRLKTHRFAGSPYAFRIKTAISAFLVQLQRLAPRVASALKPWLKSAMAFKAEALVGAGQALSLF